MAIGAFIGTGKELEPALERVRLAESLGYESVYTTHIAARDSLTVLTRYATVTEKVRLGHRRPADLLSHAGLVRADRCDDRRDLGRAVRARAWASPTGSPSRTGSTPKIEKPVTQMREYAGICRAILDGETPPEGEFFNTKFAVHGLPASAPSCRSTSPRCRRRCSSSRARSLRA